MSILWPTTRCSHSILSAVTNHATYSIWLLGRVSYYHESISAMWHNWNLSAISFMGSVFFSATQWHHSWFKQCLYDRWFLKLVCTRPTKESATWSHLLIWYIFCWESVLEFSKEYDTRQPSPSRLHWEQILLCIVHEQFLVFPALP